jgi:hypothetical protein
MNVFRELISFGVPPNPLLVTWKPFRNALDEHDGAKVSEMSDVAMFCIISAILLSCQADL